ncbi:hypothetical protein HS088_TW22G00335 [Tripterygium wilfordii]|uniref:Uncharacterized protein n=1 Tax=Tripterygium wilfordii TaxID=458696 RepID=A0A7J7BXS6_TRIWF|nr:hypothetical protein HS088_TW22G00335 [Tripterygium wilfordii]
MLIKAKFGSCGWMHDPNDAWNLLHVPFNGLLVAQISLLSKLQRTVMDPPHWTQDRFALPA